MTSLRETGETLFEVWCPLLVIFFRNGLVTPEWKKEINGTDYKLMCDSWWGLREWNSWVCLIWELNKGCYRKVIFFLNHLALQGRRFTLHTKKIVFTLTVIKLQKRNTIKIIRKLPLLLLIIIIKVDNMHILYSGSVEEQSTSVSWSHFQM